MIPQNRPTRWRPGRDACRHLTDKETEAQRVQWLLPEGPEGNRVSSSPICRSGEMGPERVTDFPGVTVQQSKRTEKAQPW